jgi:hypothetical protein
MDTLVTFCIFIVVLFLYIHVMSQFKKGEDLEIYEMDYSTGAHLQEVCDVRQPVLFQVRDILPGLFSDIHPQKIAQYSSHDVKLKDADDYYGTELVPVDAISLPLHATFSILEGDKDGRYFSEDNEEFLEESGLMKRIGAIDEILRPSFTIHSKHDVLFGSCNTATPLRYHTDYRQFLCVTSGKIRVKMTSWKSSKYLHPYKDYENYEFRSPVHALRPSSNYTSDFEKTNFIDFEVAEGMMLYIPPYWWYSIIYLDDPSTFVCKTTYSTLMNSISNLPDLVLYVLQQQNITKKVPKIPTTNIETQPEIEIGEKLTPNTITQLQPKAPEPIEIPLVNETTEPERIERVTTNNIEYAISAI